MNMTNEKILKKVENYLHFNGIELTKEQKGQVVEYLESFKDDEENLHAEMVCEIRTCIGE